MQIITTKVTKPPIIVVHAQHGIGKTTLGAECPAAIFIQTEDGAETLGVDALSPDPENPRPCKHLSEIHNALDYLIRENHSYKTLVVDSLDWLEKLIFQDVCLSTGAPDIAAIPFGRGYSAAETKWAEILAKAYRLNKEKKMMLMLLAHTQVKRFEDPERESYDRYQLDLQNKAAALVCEFADIIGYMSYKVAVKSSDGKFGAQSVKAKSSGDRVLYLSERPAFTAKNRYKLPDVIDMPEGQAWQALSSVLKASAEERKRKGKLEEIVQAKIETDLNKISAESATGAV